MLRRMFCQSIKNFSEFFIFLICLLDKRRILVVKKEKIIHESRRARHPPVIKERKTKIP